MHFFSNSILKMSCFESKKKLKDFFEKFSKKKKNIQINFHLLRTKRSVYLTAQQRLIHTATRIRPHFLALIIQSNLINYLFKVDSM